MGHVAFKKAERKQAKLRLAFTGPSGAGKTYSALLLASGLGARVAVVDTENHSASLYAGLPGIPEFDVIDIEPPYTIEKYLEAMRAAVESRYDVLVIDSISHAWAGEGGLLEKKGALDIRGGNGYTNWAPITKEHEQFKAALLHSPIHLMVTMRSKQDYVMDVNDKGKQAPRKVGLAPIQRDGMEYEFDLVLDIAMDHNASVSKTRIKGFDGKIFMPTKKTGVELLEWLNSGSPVELPAAAPVEFEVHNEAREIPSEPDYPAEAPLKKPFAGSRVISEAQGKRLYAIWKSAGKSDADVKKYVALEYGIERTRDIPVEIYEEICDWAGTK